MSKATSTLIVGFIAGVLAATAGFAFLLKFKPAAAANDQASTVLKLAHSLPTNHPVHRSIEHMKERLKQLSGGTMTIDIYPSSVLGSEEQCIEQLQNGSLTMTKTSAAAMEGFVPKMAVFGLPYLFRDEAHFWSVLQGDVGQRLLQSGEAKFLRGLCYYDAGSRNFYTKDRPIEKPGDLAKLKIRVQNSATAMEMVESFGAAPTPIAWGELYSALAQGIVDGAENNFPSFISSKHYEVCKHFALNGHSRVPDMLMIGSKAWAKLSSEQQAWLTQAAKESSVVQRELWAEGTLAAREVAESEGVTIYEVDAADFAQKVRPMLDRVENESVKSLLTEFRRSSDFRTLDFLRRLTDCNRLLVRVLNVLAIVTMSILLLSIIWGVVTRAVDEQAKWTEELARFMLIWVSLLGGAIAFRAKEHLGIDFVVSKLDLGVRKGAALFTECLVCLVAASVLIYGGGQLVRDALILEQTTPALGWQMGYVYLVLPLVGVLMCLFSVESIMTTWRASPHELFPDLDEAEQSSDVPSLNSAGHSSNTGGDA